MQPSVSIFQFLTFIDRYVELMDACLHNAIVVSPDLSLLDHRYFFIGQQTNDPHGSTLVGSSTCGIARATLASTLRVLCEDHFLGWGPAIIANYSNKPLLGFTIVQMCLSSISQRGLHLAGLDFGVMKATTFSGSCLDINIESPLALYFPHSYYSSALDGVVFSMNSEEKVAQVVLLQVAIGRRHLGGELNFFSNWNFLENQLKRRGYQIQIRFLCVTEGRRSATEVVPSETKPSRQLPPHLIETPQHERSYVTVEDIDKDIGEYLGIARREGTMAG